MAVLQSGARALMNQMPKVISPGAHAVIDYAAAAAFFAMAAFFWRRNKRAAISCITAGAAEVTTSLLTDYPGGVVDAISFPTHGKIDVGLAATVANLPDLMEFDEEPESRFFTAQGIALTLVGGMTDFLAQPRSWRTSRDREEVA